MSEQEAGGNGGPRRATLHIPSAEQMTQVLAGQHVALARISNELMEGSADAPPSLERQALALLCQSQASLVLHALVVVQQSAQRVRAVQTGAMPNLRSIIGGAK